MAYETKTTTSVPAAAEISALLNAGAAQAEPVELSGYAPIVLLPPGYSAEPMAFADDEPLPDHIKQRVSFSDLESFARYVKRYQSATTLIFASALANAAKFTAIFDYHRGGKDAGIGSKTAQTATAINDNGTQANRAAHRAVYPCPHSPEWQAWSQNNAKGMNQETFAKFIDDNMPDIVKPDSGTLLEMILNFEAKSNVNFSSALARKSGARSLVFTETIEATGGTTQGSIPVPDEILINVPVFNEGKRFDARAKIYFRPSNGKLSISYELYRAHEIIRQAVRDVTADIAAGTGIAPLLGEVE